jgi:hypothetical protein
MIEVPWLMPSHHLCKGNAAGLGYSPSLHIEDAAFLKRSADKPPTAIFAAFNRSCIDVTDISN